MKVKFLVTSSILYGISLRTKSFTSDWSYIVAFDYIENELDGSCSVCVTGIGDFMDFVGVNDINSFKDYWYQLKQFNLLPRLN